MPPSTAMITPLTYSAAGDSRDAAAQPTSSGWPHPERKLGQSLQPREPRES